MAVPVAVAAAAKIAGKAAIKEGAKQAVKAGAKQAVKEGAKQAVKEGTKQAVKEGTKQAAKDAATDAAKQSLSDSAKSAMKDQMKDVVTKGQQSGSSKNTSVPEPKSTSGQLRDGNSPSKQQSNNVSSEDAESEQAGIPNEEELSESSSEQTDLDQGASEGTDGLAGSQPEQFSDTSNTQGQQGQQGQQGPQGQGQAGQNAPLIDPNLGKAAANVAGKVGGPLAGVAASLAVNAANAVADAAANAANEQAAQEQAAQEAARSAQVSNSGDGLAMNSQNAASKMGGSSPSAASKKSAPPKPNPVANMAGKALGKTPVGKAAKLAGALTGKNKAGGPLGKGGLLNPSKGGGKKNVPNPVAAVGSFLARRIARRALLTAFLLLLPLLLIGGCMSIIFGQAMGHNGSGSGGGNETLESVSRGVVPIVQVNKKVCINGKASETSKNSPQKDDLIAVAKAEIGTDPGSGGGKYTQDLGGTGQAWCSEFAAWCFWKAFGEDGRKLIGASSWPDCCSNWESSIRTLGDDHVSDKPEVGDIVIAKNHGHTRGIVYEVNGNEYKTVEGNVGNKVKDSTFTLDDTQYFLRPDWGSSSSSSSSSSKSSSKSSSYSTTDYSDTLVIGDSICDDWCCGEKIKELMPHISINAVSSRTIEANAEINDEGILYHVEHADKKYDRYVIETGNNEGSGEGLTVAYAERILEYLGDNKDVYFVTMYSSNSGNTQGTLSTIDTITQKHVNAHKIDWYSIAKDHHDWLDSALCHPSTAEAKQTYAETMKDGLSQTGASRVKTGEECEEPEDEGSPFNGEWVYWNQATPNWPGRDPSDTYWQDGCGVCSVAMVLASYSKDTQYNPDKVGELLGAGKYLPGVGGVEGYVNAHQDIFHLKAQDTTSGPTAWKEDWDRVVRVCKAGGCVVVGSDSIGTSSGCHYVVIRKVENGTVSYANPWGGCEETCTEDFAKNAGYSPNSTQTIWFEKI